MEILNTDIEHPAFPQPADQNSTVWRYMPFNRFESLVTTQTLYMRRADLFIEDEFEGTTPAGEIESWRLATENAATEEERRTLIHNREQLAEYAEVFRKSYFLSCWHMAPEENVAMWDRYTKGTQEAVTIRTRYSTLKAQIQTAAIQFGMVRYIDYDKEQLPSMNLMHRISHKRHFFADEREVRAVMCSISPDPIREKLIAPYLTSDGCGYAPPVDVRTLVEAVVLHPKASPEFTAKVAALCAANGLPIPAPSRMTGRPHF
jgi:hypothetical protein